MKKNEVKWKTRLIWTYLVLNKMKIHLLVEANRSCKFLCDCLQNKKLLGHKLVLGTIVDILELSGYTFLCLHNQNHFCSPLLNIRWLGFLEDQRGKHILTDDIQPCIWLYFHTKLLSMDQHILHFDTLCQMGNHRLFCTHIDSKVYGDFLPNWLDMCRQENGLSLCTQLLFHMGLEDMNKG